MPPINPNEHPAFPVNTTGNIEPHCGMMMRDYFAAKAFASILCARDELGRVGFCEMKPEEIARAAYENADAMLAERSRTQSGATP